MWRHHQWLATAPPGGVPRYISVSALWKPPKVSHKRQMYNLSSPLGVSSGCWGMWSCWTEQQAGPPGWPFTVPLRLLGVLVRLLQVLWSLQPIFDSGWVPVGVCHCSSDPDGLAPAAPAVHWGFGCYPQGWWDPLSPQQKTYPWL